MQEDERAGCRGGGRWGEEEGGGGGQIVEGEDEEGYEL